VQYLEPTAVILRDEQEGKLAENGVYGGAPSRTAVPRGMTAAASELS